MSDVKKTLSSALKPFARKVGSDIQKLQSSIFNAKCINVVEYGIDNTGTTDVTEKLNKLFKKVYDEEYNEVFFPDGTYTISAQVDIFTPKSGKLIIHSNDKNKCTINLTTSDSHGGYPAFNLTDSKTEYDFIEFDGFKFIYKDDKPISSSVFTNMNSSPESKPFKCHFYNMEIENFYAFYNFSTDAEFKNVIFKSSIINLMDSTGIFDNVVFIDTGFNADEKSYFSYNNIEVEFSDNYDKSNNFILRGYTINNIKVTGKYKFKSLVELDVDTINNLILDIKKPDVDHKPVAYENEKEMDYCFIDIRHSNPKIHNVNFDFYFGNFSDTFDSIHKYIIFDADGPISDNINIQNVQLSENLSLFKDSTICENSGCFYRYGDKRLFIGSNDKQYKSSLLYLGSVKGNPKTGTNGEDYSNNFMDPGAIYTDVASNKSGHFAYITTTNRAEDLSDGNISPYKYNESDKTFSVKFSIPLKWSNGEEVTTTNTDRLYIEKYNFDPFYAELVEVDALNKTIKFKPYKELDSATIEKLEGLSGSYDNNRVTFKYNNKMNNMKYETVPIIHSGTTENRPTENLIVGQMYFDTTVGAPLFWNGTTWIQGHNGDAKPIDTSNFATKEELNTLATKEEMNKAISAIPSTSVDTSKFVTKEELEATLSAINEKLKEIHGGN